MADPLNWLQGELDKMEEDDPELKELGLRIERNVKAVAEGRRPEPTARERSVARQRAARAKWRKGSK